MGYVVFAAIAFAISAGLFYERRRQLRNATNQNDPFADSIQRYLKFSGICSFLIGVVALAGLFGN